MHHLIALYCSRGMLTSLLVLCHYDYTKCHWLLQKGEQVVPLGSTSCPLLAIKTFCIFVDSLTLSRLFLVAVFDGHVYRVLTDVSTNSVHRVLVDAYLAQILVQILDQRFTNIMPTHCRCYRDRLSVCRLTVDW